MVASFTPAQVRTAARVRVALDPHTRDQTGIGDDQLFRLFVAAVVYRALTAADAAARACAETVGPDLGQPALIVLAENDPDTPAAIDFATGWIAAGAGVLGPDRGGVAAWFRAGVRMPPAVVTLAADIGFVSQCWQLAARCHDPLIAEGALTVARTA